MKSMGNEYCRYDINDGEMIQIYHIISIILNCDCKQLANTYMQINISQIKYTC